MAEKIWWESTEGVPMEGELYKPEGLPSSHQGLVVLFNDEAEIQSFIDRDYVVLKVAKSEDILQGVRRVIQKGWAEDGKVWLYANSELSPVTL